MTEETMHVRADRDAWRDQAQAAQRLLAPPEPVVALDGPPLNDL
jgi:hypothetical protein